VWVTHENVERPSLRSALGATDHGLITPAPIPLGVRGCAATSSYQGRQQAARSAEHKPVNRRSRLGSFSVVLPFCAGRSASILTNRVREGGDLAWLHPPLQLCERLSALLRGHLTLFILLDGGQLEVIEQQLGCLHLPGLSLPEEGGHHVVQVAGAARPRRRDFVRGRGVLVVAGCPTRAVLARQLEASRWLTTTSTC
jgi:hypothetical protein